MNLTFELAAGPIAAISNDDRLVADRPLPSDPELVLLVPGFTGSKEDFLPLLRPLAGAGYRAIAFDQRGQYQSGWADHSDGYRLDALAAEVCELADQLNPAGIALHLVGHSFGGLVSRAAVLAQPGQFTDLVLMGSGPAAIQGDRRFRIEQGAAVLAESGMHALWEVMKAGSQADPRYVRLAPVLDAFLRERFLTTDTAGLKAMGNILLSEPDRCTELAAQALPILVLHGVDDDSWPPPVQAAMARALSASYTVIESAAHSPAVENPPATAAALIEFWQH